MASASPDISKIRSLIGAARRRLRIQSALEAATTATILGSVAALASVFAVRAYIVTPTTGILLLVASLGIVLGGAVVGALIKIDDEAIARRIDRASNLADRLSTAVAFDRDLRSPVGAAPHDQETRDLMRAAIRDGNTAVVRADVRAATPYHAPADLRVAGVFAGVALVGSLVGLPEREPTVKDVEPLRGCHGAEITIRGEWLCGPDERASSECLGDEHRLVFSDGTEARPTAWYGGRIEAIVPDGAAAGLGTIDVFIGDERVEGKILFEVVDCDAEKAKDRIVWEDDDRSYTQDLLDELRETAERDQIPELAKYVEKVEDLLAQAEAGELSKEQLLEELKKAEEELHKGEEPNQAEIDKDLEETGEELKKNELTKELGKALEQNDLEKAKQEMEKLAEKMEKGELSEKQKAELAKAMEKAARQFEKKQQQREQQLQQKIDKAEKELRRLQKEKDEAKDEQKKQDLERRLEKKKRELEQLQKEQEKREQSEQRRALKRLHKDMDEAAKDLQKKSDSQEQDQENQRQASQKMKEAAEETGRVDRDQRKTATTKKVSSQMDDLREAMRRAKRQGSKGPKNPFGKNGKQSDFEKRARGQKGSRGAWKPGQGKGKGQGQNGGQANGKPQGPSDTWGTGTDPDLLGDETAKSGDTKDEDVSGVHGKGPSRRETILSAAQKGFASRGYQQVYQDYKRIVEEVMRSEKVPSSYKYYIKKYFTKIKPHSMD